MPQVEFIVFPTQLNDFVAKHLYAVTYFYNTYRKNSQEIGEYISKKSMETGVALAKINSDDCRNILERFQTKDTPCLKMFIWLNKKAVCQMTMNGDSK